MSQIEPIDKTKTALTRKGNKSKVEMKFDWSANTANTLIQADYIRTNKQEKDICSVI